MKRRDSSRETEALEYARSHAPEVEMARATARSAARWSMFRKVRLILRVIYLVVCVAMLAFAWKYIQQYIGMIEDAGKPL